MSPIVGSDMYQWRNPYQTPWANLRGIPSLDTWSCSGKWSQTTHTWNNSPVGLAATNINTIHIHTQSSNEVPFLVILLAKSKMPTSQRYMSTYGYVPKEDLRKVRILYLDQGIYSTNSSNTFGTTLPTELSMKALSHHWNPRSCASVALKLRSEKFHAETWGWHESRWWSESYGGSAEWLHEVTNPWARFSMVTNDQPSMAMIIES